jgi:hypothetical protein
LSAELAGQYKERLKSSFLIPLATEAVSKVDFLTPKAFHNSAQGSTLGFGRAFEPTLKALNSYRMQNPQVNEFLNPYRVINPSGSLIPGVLPWAELGNAFGV